jgi:hypothetical protein
MDNEPRESLVARLSQAKERAAATFLNLQAHAAKIPEVREALGNPFFYSGRPESDPQSESKFTGYESHEPGLRLLREWQDASREVAAIQSQLQEAGLDSD